METARFQESGDLVGVCTVDDRDGCRAIHPAAVGLEEGDHFASESECLADHVGIPRCRVTTVGYAALGLNWLSVWSPRLQSPVRRIHFRIRDINFIPGFGMSMSLLMPVWSGSFASSDSRIATSSS